jgi:hypothetical protein
MELPQVMRREKRYFTESNVERLVEAVERRYKALIYTAAYLGLGAGDRRPPQASARRQGRKLASMRVVATIERANSW